jgi:hypothetical protein
VSGLVVVRCLPHPQLSGADVDTFCRFAQVACRDIAANEQILVDYGKQYCQKRDVQPLFEDPAEASADADAAVATIPAAAGAHKDSEQTPESASSYIL